MSFEYHNYFHLFCMTALHTGKFECENGLISLAENEINEYKVQLEWDEDKFEQEFGKFAVVVQPVEFVLRVRKAVERHEYTCNSTLVEYVDSETFDGRVQWQFIPFRKDIKYCWQQEYKIVVDTKTKGNEPLFLEIGDICDIAAKMPTREISRARKIEFRGAFEGWCGRGKKIFQMGDFATQQGQCN